MIDLFAGTFTGSVDEQEAIIGVFGAFIAIILSLCIIGIDSDRRRKRRMRAAGNIEKEPKNNESGGVSEGN